VETGSTAFLFPLDAGRHSGATTIVTPIASGEGNPLPRLHLLVDVFDAVHLLNSSMCIFIFISRILTKETLSPPKKIPKLSTLLRCTSTRIW
jgi:hypothetical protein